MSLGLFGAVLHQAGVKHQDDQTQRATLDIGDKLYSYTNDKQFVPESLAQAGIHKVPPTVTYKKLSVNTYQLCSNFKSKYIDYYHKGMNCQTNRVYIQPFIKNSDGGYTVCGVKTTSFVAEGRIVPPTFKTPNVIDVNNQIFVYLPESKAFDENCTQLGQANLHIGDKVDVFDIVRSSNQAAVPIYLKRQ